MRTLALAYVPTNASRIEEAEEPYRLAAVAAIADPVREEVPAAVAECMSAGIAVKIVTGDTAATATEIARQIGLWNDAEDTDRNRMTGVEFEAASSPALASSHILSPQGPGAQKTTAGGWGGRPPKSKNLPAGQNAAGGGRRDRRRHERRAGAQLRQRGPFDGFRARRWPRTPATSRCSTIRSARSQRPSCGGARSTATSSGSSSSSSRSTSRRSSSSSPARSWRPKCRSR